MARLSVLDQSPVRSGGTPADAIRETLALAEACALHLARDNRAMALFHSFWFDHAKRSFAKVLELDPACGMAYWGTSLMSMGNPFTWPSNPNASKAGAPATTGSPQRNSGTAR